MKEQLKKKWLSELNELYAVKATYGEDSESYRLQKQVEKEAREAYIQAK